MEKLSKNDKKKLIESGAIRLSESAWKIPSRPYEEIKDSIRKNELDYARAVGHKIERRRIREIIAYQRVRHLIMTDYTTFN